jgi:primosomal protein N'
MMMMKVNIDGVVAADRVVINIPIYLVTVKYRGSDSPREYSYYSTTPVEKGDTVTVPLGTREKRAIVVNTFEIKPIVRVGE